MSKIYVVIKHVNDYNDKPVKFFLSKKEAQMWIENNFVPELNNDPEFCDFKVKEENLTEDPNPIISQESVIKGKTWIDAYVSADFKQVRFSSFREEDEDDDFKEGVYFIKSIGEYNVFCRLPRDLKTRMDIVGFLKWFTKSHAKKA